MNLFQSVKTKVQDAGYRILLAETHDNRVLAAAAQIQKEGFCRVVLLGRAECLADGLREAGAELDRCEFLDPADPERLDAFAETYYRVRKHKGITPDEARRTVEDPVFHGALCLRDGLVDGMVAGSASPTPHVVRAALHCIGTRAGIKTLSSCFLTTFPRTEFGMEGVLLFADCGVVPEPTTDQLVDITRSAAASWRLFTGTEPVVALLSFSTKGSARQPGPKRMVEVAARLHELEPDLMVDGELQADAALVPDVARRKCPDSPVGGQANVLIFPNLEAGNIAYKLAERLGGGQAVGPLLQGLAEPLNDLSRGCNVQSIVDAAAATCAQALPT